MDQLPSSPTFRQRLDHVAALGAWNSILLEESASLLRCLEVKPTPLLVGDAEKQRSYITSLPDVPSTIIELYQDHRTSEQFHSEIKTDLDLERLPLKN